jgi:hypothetical protein
VQTSWVTKEQFQANSQTQELIAILRRFGAAAETPE